mgnify:CR=1 FL=1
MLFNRVFNLLIVPIDDEPILEKVFGEFLDEVNVLIVDLCEDVVFLGFVEKVVHGWDDVIVLKDFYLGDFQ